MNKLLSSQIKESGLEISGENEALNRLIAMIDSTYENAEHEATKMEFLEKSNEKLQKFVAIANHDLKAPLRTIGAFTQLLQRKVQDSLDESGKEYINFVLQGVQRMNKLVEDLTTFSRVDIQVKTTEVVDTHKAVKTAMNNLASAIDESGAEIKIAGNLPAILGMEFQVVQLFQNLIGNAIKFKSEATPRILLNAKETDDGIEFSISDNGIGIEDSNKDRVFEIFQRLNNTTDYEGSGLGLAICSKIVSYLEGKIWLESEVAKGTTFKFLVPHKNIRMSAPA